MPTLESSDVASALAGKLGCKTRETDHTWFLLYDPQGKLLSKTYISHGAKHTITERLISMMSKQIKLGTIANFVALV